MSDPKTILAVGEVYQGVVICHEADGKAVIERGDDAGRYEFASPSAAREFVDAVNNLAVQGNLHLDE